MNQKKNVFALISNRLGYPSLQYSKIGSILRMKIEGGSLNNYNNSKHTFTVLLRVIM